MNFSTRDYRSTESESFSVGATGDNHVNFRTHTAHHRRFLMLIDDSDIMENPWAEEPRPTTAHVAHHSRPTGLYILLLDGPQPPISSLPAHRVGRSGALERLRGNMASLLRPYQLPVSASLPQELVALCEFARRHPVQTTVITLLTIGVAYLACQLNVCHKTCKHEHAYIRI